MRGLFDGRECFGLQLIYFLFDRKGLFHKVDVIVCNL